MVKPLGFSLEDRHLKRAGLDYWDDVDVRTWDSFAELKRGQSSNTRYFFLTTKSGRAFYNVKFYQGDFLVFGRETKGLPENLLARNIDTCITIPMQKTRSLNLANAVAIVLFEAMRQQR